MPLSPLIYVLDTFYDKLISMPKLDPEILNLDENRYPNLVIVQKISNPIVTDAAQSCKIDLWWPGISV